MKKRMPYERTGTYYETGVSKMDEQICSLLKQRKEVSNGHPDYPPSDYILKWNAMGCMKDFLTRLLARRHHSVCSRTKSISKVPVCVKVSQIR